MFNPALRSSQATQDTYTLRVFVHIVRSSSGSGLSSSIVSTIISKLNSDYAGTGIQFQLSSNDFINNDAFYNDLTPAEYGALFSTNSSTNAIDIYVLGTSTNTYNVAGNAENNPSTAFFIRGDFYNTSVISHEMGHCLGLYHTHHGTVTESGDDSQCAELVNGSNSTTCGDYISDTPADPYIWNGCTYNGGSTTRDANNQTYSPNPANYMAYSAHTCWTGFSPLQRQRMKDFIANTATLQAAIIFLISGPSAVCPGSSGSFTLNNLPQGNTINWTCSPNLTVSSVNGNTAIVTNNLSGSIQAAGSLNISPGTLPYNSPDGWVSAQVTGTSIAVENYVVVNKAPIVDFDLPASFTADGRLLSVTADVYSTIGLPATVSWSVSPTNGVALSDFGGNQMRIAFSQNGNYTVTATTVNACGTYSKSKTITVTGSTCSDCPPPYLLFPPYPNPASDIFYINVNAAANDALLQGAGAKDVMFDIRLYDGYGTLLRRTDSRGGKVMFSVSDLPNGIYYLHVYDGSSEKTKLWQLIVKH